MNIDQTVLNFFVNNQSNWLSYFMLTITQLGDHLTVIGLTIVSIIYFLIKKRYPEIIVLIITIAGSATTTFILKILFFRTRPEVGFYIETGSSFPSGHATVAAALFGSFLLINLMSQNFLFKKTFISLSALMIILIGLSRLYLGVHYLSDVLAGYFIGFLWLWIAYLSSGSKIWHLLDRERR